MEVIGILDTFQDAKIEDKTLTIFQRIGCEGFSQNKGRGRPFQNLSHVGVGTKFFARKGR